MHPMNVRTFLYYILGFLFVGIDSISDTSKKRKTVRSKLAALKKAEIDMFGDYLMLTGETNNKEMHNHLGKGILPWLDDSSYSEGN